MRAPLPRTAAVPAAALVVLATALALGPDAAAAGQTRSATAHMTVFVRATARVTVSVTESATVTVSGFTASSRATAARSAASTAGAWGTAGARAVARAPRAALAVARARSMASSAARHRATARARATAGRRAYADARSNARASAVAAARAAATARARAEADAAYTAYKRRPTPSPTPAPSANCGGQTPAKPGGGTYVCSFDDEFTGTALDLSKWTVLPTSATGTGDGGVCYMDSPDNISVSGGYLNLTALKAAAPFTCTTPGGGYTSQYTGGDVATYGKFSQAYGRFDVRASFPSSAVAGLQSSLWLWPNDSLKYGAWPGSGEIDFAEEYSQYADRAIPALHYYYDPSTVNVATNTNITTNYSCTLSVGEFHDYVLEWTPTTLTITYDGRLCVVDNYQALGQTGSAPFDSPFFLALTQALGQGTNAVTAATEFPAVTRVDYVRVWK